MIRCRSTGFTLTELAVVMAIIAVLIGGLLMPLAGQQDTRNRQDTEKALAVIQESLIGFAVVNGRLPCPATPTLVSGTGGSCPAGGSATVAGCEATTGSGTSLACVNASGVLPWATLGLPETDAWGNRYTYRVTPMYARGIDPAQAVFGGSCALNPSDHSTYNPALADGPRQSAFAICTPGDITVQTTCAGGCTPAPTTLASNVPAVVISHGKNAVGAWTTQGSRSPPIDPNEAENSNDDATFVSNTAIDDLVQWIPNSQLINRMMTANKLP